MASSYRLRASTSASSSSSAQWKYDVFLSFRGEDTRKKFTDHLYDKLQWRGLKTFRDDPNLQRGTTISPELLAAIEQSRFAVVVLSPNYASSKWCLLELAKIIQCMGDRGTILPIFYEVDPSDVRHQKRSFAEAFAEHEHQIGDDLRKVQEWRDALTKVANLAGWTSNNYRYETELIKEIVEALWQKVHPTFALSESIEHLVGIDSKLMEIDFLLDTRANDVCFIGIWGMGGIGKTTLARLVYHRISHHFEVGIFLTDVRQVSAKHIQEQLLCQILKEINVEVRDVYDGMTKIKRCLFNKKVLLVLDDVDQLDQLENLAGGKDWFGSGSIVIVTTRDQRLLVLHGIETQYKSKGLNEYEALQLFSWKAFKKDYPEEGYRELSKSILDYARGLPLALKILGSFLYKRDRGDWESTVAKLKKAPIDQALFKALRISYDGLDEMSQQVFLDVACFLKGNDKERVIRILDSFFGFDTSIMVSVLIEKSLLTIFDNCVDMHDLLQEMGRQIVRLESEKKPGQRSRLWLRDDIFRVLKQNAGTETIRSIALCLPKVEELAWNPNAFHMMSELKFLKIQNLVLCQGPKCLPDDIRVLEWNLYPSKSLPADFQPVELFELILHHSKIDQIWHGRKHLEKLTIIDLSYSENLTMSPDFSGIPNLERLILEGCTNLVAIHPSITSLRRLKILNFKKCRSIKSLPSELEIDSLERVDLSDCSNVDIFPRFVLQMKKLSELSFGGIGMQSSDVSSCYSVGHHHPLSPVLASLKNFCFLKGLNLNGCKLGEGAIPDDIGCLSSVEELDLSVNNFVSLPASISRLSKLKCLNLADCKRLKQLPCLPSFSGTCDVTADNCISLEKFPDPPELCRLWKLSFNFINCCSIGSRIEDEGVYESSNETIEPMWETMETMPRRPMAPMAPPMWLTMEPMWDAVGSTIPFFSGGRVEDDSEDNGVDGGVEEYGSTCYIIYSMLQRFLQEPPPFFEIFSTVIPGNSIPGWFKNRRQGHSVRQAAPDCSSCRSKWIGFALCVIFGAEENPSAFGEDHAKTISCSWKPGLFIPASFSLNLNQVVKSDHLCVFLLPSKHYPEYTNSTDPEFIDFFFGADSGLKVKKCGVRTLYKQEVKELDLRIDQHNRSIRMVQEPPPFYEIFSTVIPGNDIPVWFETRRKRADSVSQERPCISCCKSWMGFALCVLFGAHRPCISGKFLNDDLGRGLHTHRANSTIWCSWKANPFSLANNRYSCAVNSSDHLCVFFIPADKFLHLPKWVDFEFKSSAVYLKVKGYGVRSLYEHDLPRNLANASLEEQLLWSINNCRSS
ncbi:disease resistance protein RUN1-like [Rosa sericea]